MRHFKFLCLVFLLSLVIAPKAWTGDIATTIRERYASITTFKAFFTQYLTHRESGQTEKREGTLLFKKPLLINWETKTPHSEVLVVSEKEIWDYVPEEKLAYRYPHNLVEDSRTLIQVVTGQALLSKDFDVKESGSQGELRILHLFPKDPVPQLVEAILYVDPVKGYIQRAVITDFYGNTNDVRFTSFIPDADISRGSFDFRAPKGVEVEDRIKTGVQERKLFN